MFIHQLPAGKIPKREAECSSVVSAGFAELLYGTGVLFAVHLGLRHRVAPAGPAV